MKTIYKLTTADHDRNIAGLKYVYPVISRRSGGLSIGINVNTNNACNWRCIYCQVPKLGRGAAPEVDWDILQDEFRYFLQQVLHGDFYQRFSIPEHQRRIKDIAFSGNGEPTSVKNFERLVAAVGEVIDQITIPEAPELVLITNGSLIHRQDVQSGIRLLEQHRGKIWFKLDSASVEGRKIINNAVIGQRNYVDNLITAASLCPTWLQTCVFSFDKQVYPGTESYLTLLRQVLRHVKLEGVLLYSIARPSLQPEAPQLEKCTEPVLQALAEEIRKFGIKVRVSA